MIVSTLELSSDIQYFVHVTFEQQLVTFLPFVCVFTQDWPAVQCPPLSHRYLTSKLFLKGFEGFSC